MNAPIISTVKSRDVRSVTLPGTQLRVNEPILMESHASSAQSSHTKVREQVPQTCAQHELPKPTELRLREHAPALFIYTPGRVVQAGEEGRSTRAVHYPDTQTPTPKGSVGASVGTVRTESNHNPVHTNETSM